MVDLDKSAIGSYRVDGKQPISLSNWDGFGKKTGPKSQRGYEPGERCFSVAGVIENQFNSTPKTGYVNVKAEHPLAKVPHLMVTMNALSGAEHKFAVILQGDYSRHEETIKSGKVAKGEKEGDKEEKVITVVEEGEKLSVSVYGHAIFENSALPNHADTATRNREPCLLIHIPNARHNPELGSEIRRLMSDAEVVLTRYSKMASEAVAIGPKLDEMILSTPHAVEVEYVPPAPPTTADAAAAEPEPTTERGVMEAVTKGILKLRP